MFQSRSRSEKCGEVGVISNGAAFDCASANAISKGACCCEVQTCMQGRKGIMCSRLDSPTRTMVQGAVVVKSSEASVVGSIIRGSGVA